MSNLRIGICGCGMIAEHHLKAIKLWDCPVTITAAIDPSEARRNAIGAMTGAKTYASLDEALEDAADDMDAIAVMLPHDLHAEYAFKVLAAGKHLFLEKPVARHADECQQIFDAAATAFKATSTRFFMAENSSFWPEVYRAKQLIREGAIGEVVTARSHYYEASAHNAKANNHVRSPASALAESVQSLDDTPMNPEKDIKKQEESGSSSVDSGGGGGGGDGAGDGVGDDVGEASEDSDSTSYERANTGWLSWRSSLERSGGGVVMDGGQHWIRPLKVLEGESMAHAILEFESGKHASFQATVLGASSAMMTKEPCFRVIGTTGEIVIVGGFGAGGYIVRTGGVEEPLLPEDAPGGFLTSFGPQMTDFAHAIQQDKPFHRGPEYSMGDLLVAKAIYKSAKSRAWVDVWDAKTAHFKQTFSP